MGLSKRKWGGVRGGVMVNEAGVYHDFASRITDSIVYLVGAGWRVACRKDVRCGFSLLIDT